MNVIETSIPGLLIIEPIVFTDSRGYFFESYNNKTYVEAGIKTTFVQDNQSKSCFGVIRGLHYQLEPFAQSKLIYVMEGKVLDVVVDIRKNSPTFKKWFSIELSAENQKQLFIPKGFAHGFSVLSKTSIFCYKCDNFYNAKNERGILFNDPELNIDWQIDIKKAIISEKDKINPLFKQAEINYLF